MTEMLIDRSHSTGLGLPSVSDMYPGVPTITAPKFFLGTIQGKRRISNCEDRS